MISRKGVPRVVWERRRNRGLLEQEEDEDGEVDLIPFLSVSRSLGDFWSFNPRTKQFVVSPRPDVHVLPLNLKEQKFVVVATDGLWNVMTPREVVEFIWDYEHDDQKCHQPRDVVRAVINEALMRWKSKNLLADNIAVLIAFLSSEEAVEAQPSLSGLSGSSCPSNDQEVPTGAPKAASPTPSAETGVGSEVRENPASPPPSSSSSVINRVSNSKSGSTTYYKETFPDGVSIEYHTKVKLRHRRKGKHAGKEAKAKLQSSFKPDGLGPSKLSKTCKRERSDELDVSVEPSSKRTRMETADSGCESDEGKMDTTSAQREEKPLPSATEEHGSDSSSGVFSDENGGAEGMLGPAASGGAVPDQVEVAIHSPSCD